MTKQDCRSTQLIAQYGEVEDMTKQSRTRYKGNLAESQTEWKNEASKLTQKRRST